MIKSLTQLTHTSNILCTGISVGYIQNTMEKQNMKPGIKTTAEKVAAVGYFICLASLVMPFTSITLFGFTEKIAGYNFISPFLMGLLVVGLIITIFSPNALLNKGAAAITLLGFVSFAVDLADSASQASEMLGKSFASNMMPDPEAGMYILAVGLVALAISLICPHKAEPKESKPVEA